MFACHQSDGILIIPNRKQIKTQKVTSCDIRFETLCIIYRDLKTSSYKDLRDFKDDFLLQVSQIWYKLRLPKLVKRLKGTQY